ncbi:MAG: 4-alpha-glucanotransferase [Spirochaetaceae bacterium]|jgi:4-alpha-glucanotransferase|nr:4-alpha-glucanotransferase [Spirochaetaceae bacterium]
MSAYQKEPGPERLTGVVVPIGALRGNQSTGVGEFLDLIEFGTLCKKMGIRLIQILPVNDTGYESSPYSALTAFALHPLYLRIEAMPEAANYAAPIAELKNQFEKEVRFPYLQILRAKIKLLREMYGAAETRIGQKAKPGGPLAEWIAKNPWVKAYAVYRRLKEAHGEKSWKEWISYRDVSSEDIETLWNDERLKGEHLFWVWIQEALDAQFSKAVESLKAEGILLEGDLPILMNEDSCDVWAHPEYFYLDLSAGAPPDMYSPQGQNWGFPTYNWQTQEKDGFAWWQNRLKIAEKYYQAYRIDHVLGFFRIWTAQRTDTSSLLGRYVPYTPITEKDLKALGFDSGRIRWLSQPHIPTGEVWDSLKNSGLEGNPLNVEAERVFTFALDRIGGEELWMFKPGLRGEKDIEALGLHPGAAGYLLRAWTNRLFLEYEKGKFFPVWYCRNSRGWASLSEEERVNLEGLLKKRQQDSEKNWEKLGAKLLKVLTESSSMLPCAEDLGAVPECVPKTLGKLGILGLRVVRWFRAWDKPGQPYIPFEEYPELSVCTPSVHDSSSLREWWDHEADKQAFCDFIGEPSLPPIYNPGVAQKILKKMAESVSRFRVFPIQDLLHLSNRWYAPDPASERINVPGTVSAFNWTYRLPGTIEEIAQDEELLRMVQDLAAVQLAPKKKAPAKKKG